MDAYKDWQECNSETFWCELSCDSHVVQLYENNKAFLNLLEDFVVGGIFADACVLVIATKEHLIALEQRLWSAGLQVDALLATDQYIAMDAHQTLSRFMVDGLIDQDLFREVVDEILQRVRATNRNMRAFGEMVAILWEQRNYSATIMLEEMWNDLLQKDAFPLLCAYPSQQFSDESSSQLKAICKSHSKLVAPTENSRFDVTYHETRSSY